MAKKLRLDHELAEAINEWGWKYHHIGIPTKKVRSKEKYLPRFKIYVSGFEKSPFGVEWMRYKRGCTVNKLIQTVPHIAFEVKNLDYELSRHRFKVISKPESNTEGIRVAMIEHNGAPIELIEFKKNK